MESHFVTSTGTEIGKTVVSCLLTESLATTHERICYWKPVASGCDDTAYGYRSPDEIEVIENTALEPEHVYSTFRFHEPLSPDKAAEQESRSIDPSHLLTRWKELCDDYEAIVVEGIGGVAVPFTPNYDVASLASDLRIPVLLVVSSVLGTISHTRTAEDYLQKKGVSASGIILTPQKGRPIEDTNREHLAEFYDTFITLLPELQETRDSHLEIMKNYRNAVNNDI